MYEKILSRVFGIRPGSRANVWHGRCPCMANHSHGDRSGSLRLWVSETDGSLRAKCYKGCTFRQIAESLGTRMGEWFPPRTELVIRPRMGIMAGELVATYDYCDEAGKLLYQSCKMVRDDGSKSFFQRRPMPDGGWANTLAGGFFRKDGTTWYQVQEGQHADAQQFIAVRIVPFHLPFLASHPEFPVIVTEGEKDVLTLEEAFAGCKVCVTTNPMGAKKWPWYFKSHLAGRRVTIIPDNDDVGFEHACLVAANAIAGGCESVRVVKWPDGTPEKYDVTDWLNANHKDKSATAKRDAVSALVKASAEEYKRNKA